MQITLSINKTELMEQIGRTAAYTAAKLQDGESQYERVVPIQADDEMMQQFFDAASVELTQTLRSSVVMQSTIGSIYHVVLEVSSSFSDALIEGMQSTLAGYFHAAITARWLALSDQPATRDHQAVAAQMLTDLRRNALYKRAPMRPRY